MNVVQGVVGEYANIIIILLMACITFTVRYAFFSQALSFELSEKSKQFLSFSGPCVLAAMTAPILFNESADTWWLSPFLLAGILAIILSLLIKRTLLVVVLSMLCFFVLQGF